MLGIPDSKQCLGVSRRTLAQKRGRVPEPNIGRNKSKQRTQAVTADCSRRSGPLGKGSTSEGEARMGIEGQTLEKQEEKVRVF